MPLSPTQSRRFVAVLVAFMVALSVLAAVLILRGWSDEDLQEQIREIEEAEGVSRTAWAPSQDLTIA